MEIMVRVFKNASFDESNASGGDNNESRQWMQSHNPVRFIPNSWSSRTTSLDEVIDETGQLLTGFVNDQISSEHVEGAQYLHRPHGLQYPGASGIRSRNVAAGDSAEANNFQEYSAETAEDSSLANYRYPAYAALGEQIKQVADEYARSKGRDELRERARRQNIREINKDRFMDLLRQLFKDGITVERIIALFYFCSDLVLEAMKEFALERGQLFLQWAFDFIVSDRICQWIYDNGGWAHVLGNIGNTALKVAVGVACVAITVAAFIYIKNNFTHK